MSGTTKFYYDEIMNTQENTASLYLYYNGGNITKDSISQSSFRSGISTNRSDSWYELLRLPLNVDFIVNTGFSWGSAPFNFQTLANTFSQVGLQSVKNLSNTWHSISNGIGGLFGQDNQVREWNQNSYYNANEFFKLFGGINQSIPINFNGRVLPYINENNKYQDVTTQLSTLLNRIYSENEVESNIGDELKMNELNISESTSKLESDTKSNVITKLYKLLSNGINDLTEKVNESDTGKKIGSILNTISNQKVLVIKPPHYYAGPPREFTGNQWFSGTLAIRYGNRYLYNLLIDTMNITVSREMTTYNGSNPNYSDVALSFIPCTAITPTVMKNYIGVINPTEVEGSSHYTDGN